jgi:hypothetical protein
LFDIGIQRIGAVESRALAGVYRVGLAIACCFALSIAEGYDRVGAIFACFEAIISGTVNVECQVGSIHFNSIIPV